MTDDETLKLPAPSPTAAQKLTNWSHEPTLANLTADFDGAKPSHQTQMQKMQHWNDLMGVKGKAKPPKVKGRSSVQPKLIRRQAEWRYSALTEPFLGGNKIFKVTPVTFEDDAAAKQNELVLNWQFRTKMNRVKFIDDFVRATVDEGTSILRLGWKRSTIMVKQEVPKFDHFPIEDDEHLQAFQQALEERSENPREFDEQASPELKAALSYYDETQEPTLAEQVGTEIIEVEKVLENKPTVEVMNPENVIIDPSCNGDIDKAMFIIVSFETSKAEMLKEGKRYKNLNLVNWETSTPLSQPDHETKTPDNFNMTGARKKVVAREYWGYYDIHGTGTLVPIVATWIGDVFVRMEVNPFPDQKLPFVLVPYLPVKRDMYGEPDAELLEDNQAIMGAVTRGMIDLMGRSANSQQGMAKGLLDPLNRRRYDNGQDYEFNPNINPQNGVIDHKYPELPASALQMVQLQNQEAEALSGVKSFAGGISGEAFGDVAAGIRGVLDASSKREMAILRRMAKGMAEVATKIMSMNAVFLSDKEVIRITNTEFVTVEREDLAGNFDLEVDISTAESDNTKAQDLGFMLQTIGPNTDTGILLMILAEIADLKRMPALAHKIRTFKPQPSPEEIEMQKIAIEKARMEVEVLKSEVDLNKAKAEEARAKKDMTDLDFVEQEGGTKHARRMDEMRAQGQSNQALEVTKGLLKPTKKEEKKPDVEAAIGFNQLSDKLQNAADQPPESTVQRDELAPTNPQLNLGSMYYEPGMDPGANPNLSI